jgi:Rrf2 family transcriptional repressor of oqxAB
VVSANACWYFKSIADEAEQASLKVLLAYRGKRAGGGQKRRYQRLRSGAGTYRPLKKAH